MESKYLPTLKVTNINRKLSCAKYYVSTSEGPESIPPRFLNAPRLSKFEMPFR